MLRHRSGAKKIVVDDVPVYRCLRCFGRVWTMADMPPDMRQYGVTDEQYTVIKTEIDRLFSKRDQCTTPIIVCWFVALTTLGVGLALLSMATDESFVSATKIVGLILALVGPGVAFFVGRHYHKEEDKRVERTIVDLCVRINAVVFRGKSIRVQREMFKSGTAYVEGEFVEKARRGQTIFLFELAGVKVVPPPPIGILKKIVEVPDLYADDDRSASAAADGPASAGGPRRRPEDISLTVTADEKTPGAGGHMRSGGANGGLSVASMAGVLGNTAATTGSLQSKKAPPKPPPAVAFFFGLKDQPPPPPTPNPVVVAAPPDPEPLVINPLLASLAPTGRTSSATLSGAAGGDAAPARSASPTHAEPPSNPLLFSLAPAKPAAPAGGSLAPPKPPASLAAALGNFEGSPAFTFTRPKHLSSHALPGHRTLPSLSENGVLAPAPESPAPGAVAAAGVAAASRPPPISTARAAAAGGDTGTPLSGAQSARSAEPDSPVPPPPAPTPANDQTHSSGQNHSGTLSPRAAAAAGTAAPSAAAIAAVQRSPASATSASPAGGSIGRVAPPRPPSSFISMLGTLPGGIKAGSAGLSPQPHTPHTPQSPQSPHSPQPGVGGVGIFGGRGAGLAPRAGGPVSPKSATLPTALAAAAIPEDDVAPPPPPPPAGAE